MRRKLTTMAVTYIFAFLPLLAHAIKALFDSVSAGIPSGFWVSNMGEVCFLLLSIILLCFVDFLDSIFTNTHKEFGLLEGLSGLILLVLFFVLIFVYSDYALYSQALQDHSSVVLQLKEIAALVSISVFLCSISFQLRVGYINSLQGL